MRRTIPPTIVTRAPTAMITTPGPIAALCRVLLDELCCTTWWPASPMTPRQQARGKPGEGRQRPKC